MRLFQRKKSQSSPPPPRFFIDSVPSKNWKKFKTKNSAIGDFKSEFMLLDYHGRAMSALQEPV